MEFLSNKKITSKNQVTLAAWEFVIIEERWSKIEKPNICLFTPTYSIL